MIQIFFAVALFSTFLVVACVLVGTSSGRRGGDGS